MSYQEIFNVKVQRAWRGGREEGSLGGGGNHTGGDVWREKYCFYFYAFFFLLSLKKNDVTWVAFDISQQMCL